MRGGECRIFRSFRPRVPGASQAGIGLLHSVTGSAGRSTSATTSLQKPESDDFPLLFESARAVGVRGQAALARPKARPCMFDLRVRGAARAGPCTPRTMLRFPALVAFGLVLSATVSSEGAKGQRADAFIGYKEEGPGSAAAACADTHK